MRNIGPRRSGKKKHKKSRFRRVCDWLHLWLGIVSGIIVFVISMTGCIYAFQVEITTFLDHDQLFVSSPANAKTLPLSVLKQTAEDTLGKNKKIAFLTTYQDPERAWEFSAYKEGNPKALTYFGELDYYDIVLINPYTGKVTSVEDYKNNFFNIVKFIHWSLLLSTYYGQQIVGWATFIFVILLLTGMILWWPKKWNKSNREKSFKIKWKAKFKRLNYDLHNTLGFYAMLIALILALSGMVWSFQWFENTVYAVASGSLTPPEFKTEKSDSTKNVTGNPFDIAFLKAKELLPGADRIGMSPASGAEGAIYANGYYGKEVYYDTDGLQFDQYSGKLLILNKYARKNAGEKLLSMNYDIHVGAIWGLPGKILAFLASLIAASLPVTGLIIWLGRKKKS